jgi:hypothetical protein
VRLLMLGAWPCDVPPLRRGLLGARRADPPPQTISSTGQLPGVHPAKGLRSARPGSFSVPQLWGSITSSS